MPDVLFITHPEVVIAPDVPVVRWGLSAAGRARMTALAATPLLAHVTHVFCSEETKAIEAARLIAERRSVAPV